MTSFIGLNIHPGVGSTRQKLLDWHARTRPRWSGVMDGVQLARDIAAIDPHMNVWHRAYPDGGDESIWQRMTPRAWVDKTRAELDGTNLYGYCLNEPGFDNAMLEWLCEVIEYSAQFGLRLVVGNFSVGTPEPREWEKPAAVRLLRLIEAHHDRVVLALHEYAGGIITSGFVGGAPNDTTHHPDYTDPLNWPEPANVTMWHCGRYRFLLAACDKLKIKPPRIVITEHGFDGVEDPPTKAWLDTLPRDTPGNLRGWLSLRAAWAQMFPAYSIEQAYFIQLAYAKNVIYAPPVEGVNLYCYGTNDPAKWASFEIMNHWALLDIIADRVIAPTISEPPPADDDTQPLPPAAALPLVAIRETNTALDRLLILEAVAQDIGDALRLALLDLQQTPGAVSFAQVFDGVDKLYSRINNARMSLQSARRMVNEECQELTDEMGDEINLEALLEEAADVLFVVCLSVLAAGGTLEQFMHALAAMLQKNRLKTDATHHWDGSKITKRKAG